VRKAHFKISLATIVASIYLFGCSKDEAKESSAEKTASTTPEDVPSDKTDEVQHTSGIPEVCSLVERKEQTCVICKPRDIPILKCSGKKVTNLIVSESCTYDKENLSCVEPVSQLDLHLEYTKPSIKEKYFLNLEQVVGGIKFVVGATLKEEGSTERIVLFSLLDSFVKHKKSIFLGVESEIVVDEMLAIFVKANPLLPEDRHAAIRVNVEKSVEIMSMDIDESENHSAGIIAFLTRIVEAMKVGNEGTELANVNVDKLIETLNSPKYKGLVEELLNGFVNP